ncbi:MAG: tRNA (guanosine(46)-N7)-methyltransferase TrmB [Hyphomicrobiales bacterium]|nr:tRNA (guanosine(46)-N7)-methyltransferase TrmB [Hyphomicrobiales bacterium]
MQDQSGEKAARRALYGRSKGKALRAHHARLIAERLPALELDAATLKAGTPLFPFQPREVWLEVGFGGGEHLIAQALANPDVGLIGCEPFVNGVAKALAAIELHGLENVRLRAGDARALIEALAPASLARAFILYPDPWPKRRHNKRRVISDEMIAELARVTKPGGEVRFATDIDDYAGWTLRRFLDSPDFEWSARRADNWRIPWEGWSPTRYEAKARAAGRSSAYLTFVRR